MPQPPGRVCDSRSWAGGNSGTDAFLCRSKPLAGRGKQTEEAKKVSVPVFPHTSTQRGSRAYANAITPDDAWWSHPGRTAALPLGPVTWSIDLGNAVQSSCPEVGHMTACPRLSRQRSARKNARVRPSRPFLSPESEAFAKMVPPCEGGGIGRRARFRSWSRKGCGFESRPSQSPARRGAAARGGRAYPLSPTAAPSGAARRTRRATKLITAM